MKVEFRQRQKQPPTTETAKATIPPPPDQGVMLIGNTNSIRDSTVPCTCNSDSDSNRQPESQFYSNGNSNSTSKLVIQIILCNSNCNLQSSSQDCTRTSKAVFAHLWYSYACIIPHVHVAVLILKQLSFVESARALQNAHTGPTCCTCIRSKLLLTL